VQAREKPGSAFRAPVYDVEIVLQPTKRAESRGQRIRPDLVAGSVLSIATQLFERSA